MTRIIQLTVNYDKISKAIFINPINIALMERFDGFTNIIFSFSIPHTSGGAPYVVAVIETPEEIVAKISA